MDQSKGSSVCLPGFSFLNLLALFVLLIASTTIRMRGVFSNGISGSDPYQYWDIALLWMEGKLVLNNNLDAYRQYFRPLFYLINLVSIKLFGVYDYSLRLTVGMFETLNVLIVVIIGKYFLKSAFPAILLGLLFASIPSGILLSQRGTPHTYSTTFLLLMFLAFLIGDSRRTSIEAPLPVKWIALAGFLAGCAATTHGSTTFFGLIMVLFLLIDSYLARSVRIRVRTKRFIVAAVTFAVCFFVHYLIWGALIGYEQMIHAIRSESEIRSASPADPLKLFMTIAVAGPKSASLMILYLFYVSSFYLVGLAALKRLPSWVVLTPLLIILLFTLTFSITFDNLFFPRLYLPLNIFLVLPIVWTLHHLLSAFSVRINHLLLAVIVGYVSLWTIQTRWGTILELYKGEKRRGPRAVYDLIGHNTGPDQKLLVTPYTAYSRQKRFNAKVYFGDDARYLIQCRKGALDDFVKRNQVRYIYISTAIDERIVTKAVEHSRKLGICTGMTRDSYDSKRDIAYIRDYLKRVGALRMDFPEQYGELYILLANEEISVKRAVYFTR